MKIPFDIKFRPQIESGEYKVETRCGNPIRVLAWDLPYGFPIATAEFTEDNRVIVESYSADGWVGYGEKENNLVIVTPGPELSEFENKLRVICENAVRESQLFPKRTSEDFAKKHSAELLVLAEKEITKGHEHDVYIPEDTYYEQLKKQWEDGYDKGKAKALNDLPKWKTIKKDDNAIVRIPHVGTNIFGERMLYVGENAISIRRLTKLPGFKEDSHE